MSSRNSDDDEKQEFIAPSSSSSPALIGEDEDDGSSRSTPELRDRKPLREKLDLLQPLTSERKHNKIVFSKSIFKQIIWVIYVMTPIVIISTYLLQNLLLFVRYGNINGYQNNEARSFYRPDLPSSFNSKSGRYDDLNIEFYDLKDYQASSDGWNNDERVLFCVPLRDASSHLDMFFNHLKNLTYPHNLIDLAFLISDSQDTTLKDLKRHLKDVQNDADESMRFGRINIYEKNFGQSIGQSFSARHGFQAQGPRRKLMAIARNWLLSTALRPDHSWVYWRDIDVETCPGTIIEDLMHHDKDVIVPNVWRPLPDWLGYEQPYDLNSWQESEGGVELAENLDDNAVIVEGYVEFATWRPHLAYLRDPNGDEEVEMELDGIGGVSILSKASVFKNGANFPAFSFQKHAETEGFGKLCRTMGYSVIGLPHYTIWHIYEPSTDDIKHMEWMAEEERRRLERLKVKKIYDKAWKLAFEDVEPDWDLLKFNVFKNTDLKRSIQVDWEESDEYLQDLHEFDEKGINFDKLFDDDYYNAIFSQNNDYKNYDPNDPQKFRHLPSHKHSDINLKLKLNDYESKKKTKVGTMGTFKNKNENDYFDVLNYGLNKGEELFNKFPVNPYLSTGEKRIEKMRFVKFKKNEIWKFEDEEIAPKTDKDDNLDDLSAAGSSDNNIEVESKNLDSSDQQVQADASRKEGDVYDKGKEGVDKSEADEAEANRAAAAVAAAAVAAVGGKDEGAKDSRIDSGDVGVLADQNLIDEERPLAKAGSFGESNEQFAPVAPAAQAQADRNRAPVGDNADSQFGKAAGSVGGAGAANVPGVPGAAGAPGAPGVVGAPLDDANGPPKMGEIVGLAKDQVEKKDKIIPNIDEPLPRKAIGVAGGSDEVKRVQMRGGAAAAAVAIDNNKVRAAAQGDNPAAVALENKKDQLVPGEKGQESINKKGLNENNPPLQDANFGKEAAQVGVKEPDSNRKAALKEAVVADSGKNI